MENGSVAHRAKFLCQYHSILDGLLRFTNMLLGNGYMRVTASGTKSHLVFLVIDLFLFIMGLAGLLSLTLLVQSVSLYFIVK